jgi:hypothetical protein
LTASHSFNRWRRFPWKAGLFAAVLIGVTAYLSVSMVSYWWKYVPLAPTAVIPLPQGPGVEIREAADGEIALIHGHWGPSTDFDLSGPVEFWDSRTGKRTRQLLDQSDVIVGVSPKCRLAALRDGDDVKLIDLADGTERFRRSGMGSRVRAWFTADEGRVAFLVGNTVHVCDATNGDELWSRSRPDFSITDLSSVIQTFGFQFDPARRSTRFQPVMAFTGRPDRDPVMQRWASRDGRWVLASPSKRPVSVIDVSTGREVWKLPDGIRHFHVNFTADGRELIVPYQLDRAIEYARWNAADGRQLTDLPGRPKWQVAERRGYFSRNGRFTIGTGETPAIAMPVSIVRFLKQIGISWNGVLAGTQHVVQVTNAKTGEIAVTSPAAIPLFIFEDDRGFVVRDFRSLNHRLACYLLPPVRNWHWLAIAMAIIWMPTMAVCLFWLCRRRNARVRESALSANV